MPRHTNVSEPLTELLGRDSLVERTHALLDSGKRWVTVLGPAGVGKSRLIAAVGAGVRPKDAPGGVWSCSLAGARSEQDVCAAIALVLPGVDVSGPLGSDAVESRLERLDGVLLVLDDVEQAVPVLATLLPSWLTRVSGLRCVIGTRERLGAPSEVVVQVDPLALDDAVELFVRRALAARGAELSRAELALVPELVKRLDHLPLAIELAASHLGIVSAEELRDSLEASVLRLASPDRSANPRHASLEAALAVSWDLLEPAEREALRTLALFESVRDAASLEAVLPVGFDARREIGALRDRSWLSVQRGTPTRYALLGVVRAFVRERDHDEDDEQEPRRERYVSHVAKLGTDLLARWGETEATVELCRLASDLRVASDLAITSSSAHALDLTLALARVASVRGPVPEALQRLDDVLDRPGHSDEQRIDGLLVRGRLHARDGWADASRADFERAHELATTRGDIARAARAASSLADHLRHHGDPKRAAVLYRRALESTDDLQARARITASLAGLVGEEGSLAEARELYERAVALARAADDQLLEAITTQNLALIVQEEGDLTRAEELFTEALQRHVSLSHRRFEGIAHLDLAALALERGRTGDALREADAAVSLLEQVGDRREHAIALVIRAVALCGNDDLDTARGHFARAEMLAARLAEPGLEAAFAIHAGHVDLARARREPEGAEEHRARARARLAHAPGSDDARLATRILEDALGRAESSALAIHVALDGAWFQAPGGERVDVSTRVALRGLLARLAGTSRRDPAERVSSVDLIKAGWPAVRADTKPARNRLHVALATLRKLGVADHLERSGDAYRLTRARIVDD